MAVVYNAPKGEFIITDDGHQKTYFKGTLSEETQSPFSSKKTRVAEFSTFNQTGKFVLAIAGTYSAPFEIKSNIHQDITKASVKAFYFHRLSMPIQEQYAGQWKRKAGHPDNKVLIHPSAVSASRKVNTEISSSKGWYDAGDYNKYIVNSGITMGTMLSAYEDFPEYWKQVDLNIPESKNDIPDLLDEILWNLRWMLTMQDSDGGVYHKLTNAKFDGMVMPHEANAPRYVVQKGTAATLDFAAVTAQSARVFKNFSTTLPGLADSCLVASEKAWAWAKQNPSVLYDQDAMNKAFDPDVTTGAYGDRDVSDEFVWAASELLITTGEDQYSTEINLLPGNAMPLPSWPQVRLLGYYSLVRHADQLNKYNSTLAQIKNGLTGFADQLIAGTDQHYMRTVMGKSVRDYIWGSSSVAANESIALIQAYKITGERKYVDYALSNLDYLLGRNGTGYCFVTGFGSKRVMNPHHRPSIADGIVDPVPGWLSGGPNPGMQDKCNYPTSVADEAFVDDACSYASNEVAINWNAPLVYVSCALEALQSKVKY